MSNSTDTFVDLSKYSKMQKIGQGGFGEVYKIKEKETDQLYAAKISLIPITSNSQAEILNLSREVNNNASMIHPTILKFIGYSPTSFNNEPNPVIISEYASNGSLSNVIDLERHKSSEIIWNDTKKLINIYGISSGMKYLHENKILHRDLKPQNILMDDLLFPKIADFGLSKKIHNKNSITAQSEAGIKGTFAYIAPEVFETKNQSESSDVYAFGLILYELLTTNIPFKNMDAFQIYREVVINGRRPLFESPIDPAYRDLIERCWSQDPKIRPTFSKIVEELETNHDFILPSVDEYDYLDYVNFIKESQISFKEKKIIKLEDFVRHPESSSFRKVDISRYLDKDEQSNFFSSFIDRLFKKEKLFPAKEFSEIDEDCQYLVTQAENDPEKQFFIGTYLIEGKNKFPINVDLGVKYFERSILGKCIDSASYYSKMLIDGKLITRDLNKAKNILLKFLNSNDKKIFPLYARILYKEGKYIESRKYFEQFAKENDPYSMYKYGKMLFCGYGGDLNVEEAKHYLNLSKENGFHKSELYLTILTKNQKNSSFINLPTETQNFFVKQIIKHNIKYINNPILSQNQIYMTFKDTQKLFLNKSFDSSDFIDILKSFVNITIEILFPSKEYELIFEKVRRIKNSITKLKVLIFISGTKSISYKFGPDEIINCIKIDDSVQKIGSSAFMKCTKIKEITIPSSVTSIGKEAFLDCTSIESICIPSSVTSISDYSFRYCSLLESISIPSSVKSIGESAFYCCKSLKEVTIPSSVTSIKEFAFSDCSSLTQLIIPSSVTSIKESAFSGCESLKQIEIPSSVALIGEGAFRYCYSLKQITISSSIGGFAFDRCKSLEQVTISKTVKSMGEYSFANCSSLKQVLFEEPSSLKSIQNNCFEDCKSLDQITIPSSLTSIGDCAFLRCSSLKQVTFETPSSLKSIGNSSFCSCSSLTQITIPSPVSSVGDTAFYGCSSLTYIEFPSSLRSIEEFALYDCQALAKVIISEHFWKKLKFSKQANY